MEPVRVAVLGINYAPEPTGIAPYTAGLAEGLRRRGHVVRVLTTFQHYPDWRFRPEDGVWRRDDVVNHVPVRRLRHYLPRTPSGWRRAVSEVSFGTRLLASSWHGAEVVLMPSPAMLATAVAQVRVRGSRRPAVGVIVQDLYSAGLSETHSAAGVVEVLAKLESRVLRRADGVAVIHDRFKKRVVTELGVAAERVHVIRNWTHVQPTPAFDRTAFRGALGWRRDEHIVLHTGAMGEKQDLGNVVSAARIADRRSLPVRFVLVGDGGQRPRLEADGAGVERLDFLPPLSSEDYPKLLASADILLVNERPGHVETAVPSKLTSYFSSGRPVVAATEPGSTTADEVADSGAGRRVAPGDPEALVAALLEMASNPEQADALGSFGPRYCARVLSEEASIDAYDALVRRLAAARSHWRK